MYHPNTHKIVLVKILKEIYSDPLLRSQLGFKGGTAALLFYNLPRESVDLDFDLLKTESKNIVFDKLSLLLKKFGSLKEIYKKRYTLFFLLSYTKDERNIKIEISKRPSISSYNEKSYLGIPVLVMKKEDMVANKILAILTRRKFASRDLFDLWFFLKNEFPINENIIKEKMGVSVKQAIKKMIEIIVNIKNTQLLQGLGEFVDEKQKTWIKEKMKDELLIYLRLYLA